MKAMGIGKENRGKDGEWPYKGEQDERARIGTGWETEGNGNGERKCRCKCRCQ